MDIKNDNINNTSNNFNNNEMINIDNYQKEDSDDSKYEKRRKFLSFKYKTSNLTEKRKDILTNNIN